MTPSLIQVWLPHSHLESPGLFCVREYVFLFRPPVLVLFAFRVSLPPYRSSSFRPSNQRCVFNPASIASHSPSFIFSPAFQGTSLLLFVPLPIPSTNFAPRASSSFSRSTVVTPPRPGWRPSLAAFPTFFVEEFSHDYPPICLLYGLNFCSQ